MSPNLQRLHALGQSVWVDNITRKMLGDGTLKGYIDELSVTGLTSNPTIFEHAIGAGDLYDEQIAELPRQGRSGEDLLFELALRDLRQAADLFRPVFDATDGVEWLGLARSLTRDRRHQDSGHAGRRRGQGVIWAVDSFDQWDVELGKMLAQRTIPELESADEPTLAHDSSTNALVRRYRRVRATPASR